MRITNVKVVLVFAAIVCFAKVANAGFFEMGGAACIPDDASYVFGNVSNANIFSTQKNASSVPVTLYCALHEHISAPSTIGIGVIDSNSSSANQVVAYYVKMHKTTGATTTIATVSSQSGLQNGSYQILTTSFSDSYSPTTFWYYVVVQITGVFPNAPIFFGVAVF